MDSEKVGDYFARSNSRRPEQARACGVARHRALRGFETVAGASSSTTDDGGYFFLLMNTVIA